MISDANDFCEADEDHIFFVSVTYSQPPRMQEFA